MLIKMKDRMEKLKLVIQEKFDRNLDSTYDNEIKLIDLKDKLESIEAFESIKDTCENKKKGFLAMSISFLILSPFIIWQLLLYFSMEIVVSFALVYFICVGFVELRSFIAYLFTKKKYRDVLSDEILELVSQKQDLELQKNILESHVSMLIMKNDKYGSQLDFLDEGMEKLEEIISENSYSFFIEYQDCVQEYKAMLNDFLSEKVDYSQVHLRSDFERNIDFSRKLEKK